MGRLGRCDDCDYFIHIYAQSSQGTSSKLKCTHMKRKSFKRNIKEDKLDEWDDKNHWDDKDDRDDKVEVYEWDDLDV